MYSKELAEKMAKLKLARCSRCQSEDKVKWSEHKQKICLKCFKSEGILQHMYLVPARYIDHEAVATVEEDYEDWDEADGYKQEELQTG